MKRTIAAFDFDGTLTVKDSFPAFIKFALGPWRTLAGFALFSPMLALMKLGLYPGSKAKQQVFSHFFKGMDYQRFRQLGRDFANVIEGMRNEHTITRLKEHMAHSDTVYVITASIAEWVEPWCLGQGVDAVLATRVDVDDRGLLTGRFKTRNCNGQEKVARLLAIEPARDSYRLCAYGDSPGDKPLLAFADVGTLVDAGRF